MPTALQCNLIDETLAGPFGKLPLAKYLHENGQRWEGSHLPHGIKKMSRRQCFRNAWELSLRHGFPYCEGYGWDVTLGAMPFGHAWNLCPQSGRVIDATWAIGEKALYLGVELSPNQLMRIVDFTGCLEVLQSGRRAALELVSQVRDQYPVSLD
ncbi:hypothetical protein ACW9UR_23795 [Halovulum sp. GXIMD14794]